MSSTEPQRPEREPGLASVEEGLVVLEGPDGVAVTMEADAAAETGRRLMQAADAVRHEAEPSGES